MIIIISYHYVVNVNHQPSLLTMTSAGAKRHAHWFLGGIMATCIQQGTDVRVGSPSPNDLRLLLVIVC